MRSAADFHADDTASAKITDKAQQDVLTASTLPCCTVRLHCCCLLRLGAQAADGVAAGWQGHHVVKPAGQVWHAARLLNLLPQRASCKIDSKEKHSSNVSVTEGQVGYAARYLNLLP